MDRIRKKKILSVSTKNFETKQLNKYYSEKNPGEFLALWNSQDFLEIAKNQGHAARTLQFDIEKDLIFIEVG
jgi:S-adenosylmethionine hydrolase